MTRVETLAGTAWQAGRSTHLSLRLRGWRSRRCRRPTGAAGVGHAGAPRGGGRHRPGRPPAGRGLDLVVLATPSGGDHAAHALRAIEAGIAVVVDKPLAVSADAALEVVDAAEHAEVHDGLPEPALRRAEHVTLAEVVRSDAIDQVYRAELLGARRPEPKQRWREQADPEQGGGILLDLHSHLVDAAVQLFGEVETVYAEFAARTTNADDDAFWPAGIRRGWSRTSARPRSPALPARACRCWAARVRSCSTSSRPRPTSSRTCATTKRGWIYRGEEREPVARSRSSQVDFYRAVAEALRSDSRCEHAGGPARRRAPGRRHRRGAHERRGRQVVDIRTGERID